MSTKTLVADHRSAIKDLAKTVGMEVIHEQPGFTVIADSVQADEYLNGKGSKDVGVLVEIVFNERGEIKTARKRVDGVSKGDITGNVGNAGQRLLWTLHLFSRR